MMLSSVFVLASFSGNAIDGTTTNQTKDIRSSDYLLKRTFLFGRVQNMSGEGNYTTVETVNLRIIFFKPVQFFHYTTGETITFSNQFIGMIRPDRFLMGIFTVVLPINTNSIAVMNTTMGAILIELYEDKTPITTANFIKLTNDGFYNGLVFHRVIDDFVIQGGGYYPDGTEKISPYGPIDLEINPDCSSSRWNDRHGTNKLIRTVRRANFLSMMVLSHISSRMALILMAMLHSVEL